MKKARFSYKPNKVSLSGGRGLDVMGMLLILLSAYLALSAMGNIA